MVTVCRGRRWGDPHLAAGSMLQRLPCALGGAGLSVFCKVIKPLFKISSLREAVKMIGYKSMSFV